MRYINILAAVAATLAIGSTASAKDKPSEPRKEKKICRHEPSSTSRLGTRICKTKAEWDARRNQETIEDNGKLQSMGRVN